MAEEKERDSEFSYQNEEHLRSIEGIGKKYAEKLSKHLNEINIKREDDLRKHMDEHEEKGTVLASDRRLHNVVARHLESKGGGAEEGPKPEVIKFEPPKGRPAPAPSPAGSESPKPEKLPPAEPTEVSEKERLETELLRQQVEATKKKAAAEDKVKKAAEAKERSYRAKLERHGGTIFAIIALIIYCLDAWVFGFVGFVKFNWFEIPHTILGIVGSAPFILGVVLYILTIKNVTKQSILNAISFVSVIIFFIITFGASMNPYAAIHLIFVGLFWYVKLYRPAKDVNEGVMRANFYCMGLIFLDFYIYSILASFSPLLAKNMAIIPIMPTLVTGYIWSTEENKAAAAVLFIILFIAIFSNYQYFRLYFGAAGIIGKVDVVTPKEVLERTGEGLKNFWGDIVKSYERQMEYATGGYYQGRVEENEDPRNELGVHIENLEAADKQFYQNEQVVVWGDLKAKTLDKSIYIYMSCESDGIKGEIKPDKLSSDKGYEIERLEQMPFECRFSGGQLKAGTNNIKVKAEFNFETLGYLKTYFMDIERIRALRKENIDPLRQYGIDKRPKARYTNGPVKLGMGSVDPPVGLSTTSDGYSYIGVTVQPQWYGKIKNITNLTIQVPKDLQVERVGEFYCRNGFEKVPEDKEGYSIYKMRGDVIKKIKTPIEAYKSWRCSINIPSGKVSEILGNTPVAIYYYRASVDYIYEIEKSTSVYIKAVPGEKRVLLLDCKTVCDDSDGCICNNENDECGVPKNETIEKGFTCNNAPVGSNRFRRYERTIDDIENATEFIDGYLALNWLCARANETTIDKDLEIFGYKAVKETKEEIKEIVKKCRDEDYKTNKIESKEGEIVDKIVDMVKIFENAKENLKEDLKDESKRSQLNNKKTEFIAKIDKVKSNFEEIKNYINKNFPTISIQDAEYYQKLTKAKTDLEGITYEKN